MSTTITEDTPLSAIAGTDGKPLFVAAGNLQEMCDALLRRVAALEQEVSHLRGSILVDGPELSRIVGNGF